MMKYKKHPLENLTPGELSEVAAYEHPLSAENETNIKSRFMERTSSISDLEVNSKPVVAGRKRPRKALFVALAAVIALFSFGFTFADQIQEAYYNYFGEGAEVASRAADIGTSDTDQGIQMEVLSALNDGAHTYLVVSLKDLSGDRLSEDMQIEDLWSFEGGRDLSGGRISVLSYDASAKTAILMVDAIGGQAGKDVIFTLPSFVNDEIEFDVIDNTLDLATLANQNADAFEHFDTTGGLGGGYGQEFIDDGRELRDISQVLKRDAMNVQIPGYEKGYLSNIAYKDGYLHVQINPDSTTLSDGHFVDLVNNRTGDMLGLYYSVNYGDFKYGDSITCSSDYSEYVFAIDESDLKDYSLRVSGFYYTSVFNGNLQVSFTVPEQMESIAVSTNLRISSGSRESLISKIEVSPLSITLDVSEGNVGFGDIDLSLVYMDGSSVIFGPVDSDGASIEESQVDQEPSELRYNGFIANFENLVAVEVNGNTIELR